MLGFAPRSSNSVDFSWGLRVCISNRLPLDNAASVAQKPHILGNQKDTSDFKQDSGRVSCSSLSLRLLAQAGERSPLLKNREWRLLFYLRFLVPWDEIVRIIPSSPSESRIPTSKEEWKARALQLESKEFIVSRGTLDLPFPWSFRTPSVCEWPSITREILPLPTVEKKLGLFVIPNLPHTRAFL